MATPDEVPTPVRADDDALATPMPAAEHLGVELVSRGADAVVCRLRIRDEHLNQALIGHGGVLFTLADTALGLLTNPPDADVPWVGTSFAVQFLRGVVVGDVVVATARREHRSSRLQAVAARLTRGDDLVGTVSAQLMAGRPIDPARPEPTRHPVDGSEPLPRALRAAAERHGNGPVEVLRVGEQPVGFEDADGRWLHPRWRG